MANIHNIPLHDALIPHGLTENPLGSGRYAFRCMAHYGGRIGGAE